MFYDVCELGMNNFLQSIFNVFFFFDQVVYGIRGVKGEIQFVSKNGICIIIFVLFIV